MKRRLQILTLLAVAAILASTTIFVFLENMTLESSNPETFPLSQQYLQCKGVDTKIFLVASTSSYGIINETYTIADERVVQKGTSVFVTHVTIRNDYTSENPPPPNESPTAPADGTAYVYFAVHLQNENGKVAAADVSVSDFSVPSVSGYGIVLASGQTATANVYMLTNKHDISEYWINLISVTDSVPSFVLP